MTDFAIDTRHPLPGPYRMPTDCERRTRVYLEKPYRDIPTVCEMNPDIQEHLDATMRLFVAAPDLYAAAKALRDWDSTDFDTLADQFHCETGFIAPGKDIAARDDMHDHNSNNRLMAWQAWYEKSRSNLLAAIDAALAKAEGRTP